MSEIKIMYFFIYQIGYDVIHHLTNRQQHSLYVIFKHNNGVIFYQKYEEFSIGDESTNYQLNLAGLNTGNLGRYLNLRIHFHILHQIQI